MRFYFAGSFNRREELLGYALRLETLGHAVTSRWLLGTHEVLAGDDELSTGGRAPIYAREDLEDIDRASGFVLFSSKDHPQKGRGGRHTEFGCALQSGKMIVIIGRREHAFHSLIPDFLVFKDFDQFFRWLTVEDLSTPLRRA